MFVKVSKFVVSPNPLIEHSENSRSDFQRIFAEPFHAGWDTPLINEIFFYIVVNIIAEAGRRRFIIDTNCSDSGYLKALTHEEQKSSIRTPLRPIVCPPHSNSSIKFLETQKKIINKKCFHFSAGRPVT